MEYRHGGIEGTLRPNQKNILIVCPDCGTKEVYAFWNIKEMRIHFRCTNEKCKSIFIINDVEIQIPINKGVDN